jgi:nucleoside-diphosphate-sugar epimerase
LADFVISGAGGFIGRSLTAALAARGLTVIDYRAFRDSAGSAGTFVHCANIHDNARENAILAADVLATVAPRVRRFVQFLSFATLHGGGALDPARFNCGKTPLLMAPYPYGKLLQEEVLCRDAPRHAALALRLVYLPAVLGEGGSWSAALATARRHGVVLPPRMGAAARANHIETDVIAAHLAGTTTDLAPGIARAILNRPVSATLHWRAFFAGAAVTADGSPQGLAKLAATSAALAGYRAMTALRPANLPPGTPDRRPPRPPAPPAAASADDTGPLRFTGLIAHIVRTQPYIPATA